MQETQPPTRMMSDVEYSVEESYRTAKNDANTRKIESDKFPALKKMSLPRSLSNNAFRRGGTLKAATDHTETWCRKSSLQGTTRIDFPGSQVESQTKENEGKLFSSRAHDSRLLPETTLNIFDILRQKPANNHKMESRETQGQSQVFGSKYNLRLDVTHSNRTLPRRTISTDGRCPINLSSKRSSLVKLEPHRGDQDLPYLLDRLGMLESQSSRSVISLQKVTIEGLHKSWFGPKRAVVSRTMEVEPKVIGFNPFYQDKLSIGQYTLDKLHREKYAGSQGYKRVNFFSSRLDGTILTTES